MNALHRVLVAAGLRAADDETASSWRETHEHHIPDVTLQRNRRPLLFAVGVLAVVAWLAYRAVSIDHAVYGDDHLAWLWTVLFLIVGHQVVLAWVDRPFTVTDEQRAALDPLFVTVNIPLYNESEEILDRVLYSLSRQTRLPQRIEVVDNGSTVSDYTAVREYWAGHMPAGIEFSWVRTGQIGKRAAQAVTFEGDDRADVFVTLDSDSALERRAVEEGLKPFANPRVMSVAGIEMAYNAHVNLLTRICGLRQLTWQLTTCSALSVMGNVLVNRGTYALYRAEVINGTLDAYTNETFLGREVKYSDDSMLTLYALRHGRAVQQLTAVQFPAYPETVDHHLRQWIRWMRGSTIRSIWRARYLPLRSYGWWMSIGAWWLFAMSTLAYVFILGISPLTGHFASASVAVAFACGYLLPTRNLLLRRSDETTTSELVTFLVAPLSWAWSMLVLRPLRVYSMATCGNAAWGTRAKVEVGLDRGREPVEVGQES